MAGGDQRRWLAVARRALRRGTHADAPGRWGLRLGVAEAAALLALALLAGASCRGETPSEPPADAGEAARPPAEAEAGREEGDPPTEKGLVRRVARAIEARDLARLRELAAPELSADLRRMHREDPDGFWRRGQRWVDNVRSGFEIAHRQDDSQPRWRVLVRFGNGREETVTFTRVDGKLRLDAL